MMIQKRIYSLIVQRAVMTLLMMVLSATAMWAAQTITVNITGGNATWSLKVDGTEVLSSSGGQTSVSVNGKTDTNAELIIKPSADYEVFNFIIYKTVEFSSSPTRADLGTIDYQQSGTSYTFKMPAEENRGVYISAEVMNYTSITSLSSIEDDPTRNYVITTDISVPSDFSSITSFSGRLTARAKADGTFPVITGLKKPIFITVENAIISNLMFKSIDVSGSGNVGAICGTAIGSTRIYNCGVLPSLDDITYDSDGNITSFGSTVSSSGGDCGSLVGEIPECPTRVVNCFSYAFITGGTTVAGIVGNNKGQTIYQGRMTERALITNCMFYGDITGGTTKRPVYGGNMIKSNDVNGVNPYDYFRANAKFDDAYTSIEDYNRSWPAEEEYLTRFEYYRSILNSNRLLCTYYVTDHAAQNQTADDKDLIAKWVLDPAIAPYPILKKWGKYPSIINPDKEKTIDPRNKIETIENGVKVVTKRVPTWTSRSTAKGYEGKFFSNLSVTVDPGDHAASGISSTTLKLPITDMDTLNYDYSYYKVQLPYYNEVFGNPNSTDHDTRYGGNYKDYVVTGWKITLMDKTGKNSFVANWESGYNFADRNCTDKDLYSVSGRVFAQGGFFYVPEGVTSINIEAYWGKAVYLHNSGHYIDRVNITNSSNANNGTAGNPFTPAGMLPTTFQGQTVYDSWTDAVKALDNATTSGSGATLKLNKTVYDQAIVLLSNFQWKNQNAKIGYDIDNKWHPYTLMSIDQDLDNEPDYCFEYQYRNATDRKGMQPVRFDFLPVPELGLAVRHNQNQNTIGIFVPQGHFEITETSYMHTTQFEYDAATSGTGACGTKIPAPIILNGGHFEQIVVRYGPQNNTQYFLMGGHFRMLRFTPGAHTSTGQSAKVRLCAVNAIGGEYPEFYLSGYYRPDINPESVAKQGNPHCYTNGGKFDIMAGAGYDKILGSVTFKIDHSYIGEFYGGGINGSKPIGGNIDVTIDHSLVGKYCGGPKVGVMNGQTVTTHATGTTFTKFYGGGNGGTSYYRWQRQDGNVSMPASTAAGWAGYGYKTFNPLNSQLNDNKQYEGPEDDPDTPDNRGYNALFEFECFVESNGLGGNPTIRSYMHWAQFGTTSTGNITNILDDCFFENDFYGGGNLANVGGDVTSTLTGCTVKGNAFGGGYSGKIEPFRVHDRTKTEFPFIDKAGVMHNGTLYYVKNTDGTDRYYTWCYKDPTTGEMFPEGVVIPNGITTNNPTFEYPENSGKWYVLTTVSLEGLGAVSGNTTLNLKGSTVVGTAGVNTTGNVYGGGSESAVEGNTNVNICAVQDQTDPTKYSPVTGESLIIRGNVFGGGKGIADSFKCLKAMVGVENANNGGTDISTEETNKGTKVIIGNGTVNGTVYGGGEVGRVEWNTVVKIGLPSSTSEPEILGNVFGAGKGVEQYGYAALVRGNTFVTVQGGAKVGQSVYGGGEIASVGKYEIATAAYATSHPEIEEGMPYSLANNKSGYCNVTVRGNAKIGPDNMKMYHSDITDGTDKPDDSGHVFGAGKGILPYADKDHYECKKHKDSNGHGLKHPGRMAPGDVWECYEGYEKAYLLFVETQALATRTNVIIGGDAFVKGSVYGGSENGHVQHDTHVTIEGNCQIGNGFNPTTQEGVNRPYTSGEWESESLYECAHWDYESNEGAPYDPYAIYEKNGKYYYDQACTDENYAEGGAKIGKDGHTYYGNVFGGGSGVVPYAPKKWHRAAGSVGGNTVVDITGGHILTSVYGGNEQTDVGTYKKDNEGNITTTPADKDEEKGTPGGKCTINMTGGTVGVPRTKEQMQAHPVTCYVFGAGKGDQRVFFNTWTNVINTEVNITGTARIYGSTFGGGEDGHVIEDATTNIGKKTITIGSETKTFDNPSVRIGSTGTSGVDGNIFGGGRGFSGTALTAGVVGGNVYVNIDGGTMLGSIFGGGRLASVGTNFVNPENAALYGKMQDDTETKTHGHITININGGTIGATDGSGNLLVSDAPIGDVYGGCKGTLDGSVKLGISKDTKIEINGASTKINNSVYGGGEAGNVQGNVEVTLNDGTIGGDIYGGGALAHTNIVAQETDSSTPLTAQNKTTSVTLHGGTVNGNVYGGGLGRMEVKYQAAVDPVGEPGQEGYIPGKPEVKAVDGIAAKVCGDVTVELNKNNGQNETEDTDNCIVKGSIFGCNNLNGTPLGNVTVHVYKTVDWTNHAKTPRASLTDPDNSHHTYNLAAVYGGGNLAAYEPTNAMSTDETVKESAFAHVIIEGCGLTSIRQVYGGGNAASTPSTKVEVLETYEIEEVFGGGNGLDDISKDGGKTWITNPGANVGFRDYWDYANNKDMAAYDTKEERLSDATFLSDYVYGSGKANVDIKGGTIHRVFGGSNNRGNVRQTAVTMLAEEGGCPFCVDEAYGGGKSAPMDAEAKLMMACIPGLKVAYGGAEAADIQGDVTLTITNGTFNRVFGGNNISGTIRGSIKVNIEETGCRPIIIGELYGGGNQAAYSVRGYKKNAQSGEWEPRQATDDLESGMTKAFDDPVVNVKSFTSIGNIYGGGYGSGAVMVGSPTVNINVAEGDKNYYTISNLADDDGDKSYYDETGFKELTLTLDGQEVKVPAHKSGKIGAVNNIFGGGNAANVKGDTHVNIGTETEVYVMRDLKKDAVIPANYYTRNVDGTYTAATGTAPADGTYYEKQTVMGADIRGNVYGGGNKADVTGNTNVNIGLDN